MAVALRLKRKGTHKRPIYDVVAIHSRKSRDGEYLKRVGQYDPLHETLSIDLAAADSLLAVGAQPSAQVAVLLKRARKAAAAATGATAT